MARKGGCGKHSRSEFYFALAQVRAFIGGITHFHIHERNNSYMSVVFYLGSLAGVIKVVEYTGVYSVWSHVFEIRSIVFRIEMYILFQLDEYELRTARLDFVSDSYHNASFVILTGDIHTTLSADSKSIMLLGCREHSPLISTTVRNTSKRLLISHTLSPFREARDCVRRRDGDFFLNFKL